MRSTGTEPCPPRATADETSLTTPATYRAHNKCRTALCPPVLMGEKYVNLANWKEAGFWIDKNGL
jgi:hypothetical protein